MFEKLKGSTVVAVALFGTLPEIEVSLSNGLRVVSFMTAEGQPEWAIICRTPLQKSLGVKHGRLHVEELAPNKAFKRTGYARRLT